MSFSSPRRVALCFGFAAAVATLLGGAGCGSKDRFASVNGQVISRDDYMRALERAPITVPTAPGAPPQQVPAGRFVLDQLVGNKVVMAEASRLQVAPTDNEINKRFDLQKRLMKEQMPDKDFDKEMKNQGRTEQDVKDEIRAQLAETNLLAKRLDLKEEAVKKAYDSQKTVLGFPDRAQLRLIVAQAGSPEFQQAQQMLASKTDFAEVAKKVNAPALRANGGLLAQALPYKAAAPGQQSIPAPWVAKVKATAEGGYFGPVDFPGQPNAKAWVRVEHKLPAYQLTYEDAKPLIRQALVRQQMTDPKNRPIRDSIMDMKMKAKIETGDERYKTVWEAVKEQARASGIGADATPGAGMVPQAPGPALPATPPPLPAPAPLILTAGRAAALPPPAWEKSVIHLVGLGPGDPASLRPQAFALLARHDLPLFLRTRRHPTLDAEPVRSAALAGRDNLVPFDDEYERHASFDAIYETIVARVLRAAGENGEIVYAVPGHPLVGETTVARLLPRARAAGVATRVVGAPSFVDACLEAVGEAITGDLLVLDALALEPNAPTAHPALRTPGAPLLLYQVHDRHAASNVKLVLMRAGYPDDFAVTVVRAAGVPGEEKILPVPLFALDRNPAAGLCDHLASVWVPPLAAEARPPGLDGLVRVMARLRDPDGGCPWDREQTHATLRPYVLEEAYEVAEAIDGDDSEKLCDELGDLLLQVVFHAQLAAEEGIWDIEDVCAAIVAKLIRRHPHVFGGVKVDGANEVLTNWNAIKAAEKGNEQRRSVLDGIPTSLPALSRALQVSRRAVRAGFEWPDTNAVLAKVDEELAELRAEIAQSGPPNKVAGELGDLLFTLVNVARRLDLDPENALRGQMKRFEKRFRHIEERARECGARLDSLTLNEMEAFWQEAKQQEKNDEH